MEMAFLYFGLSVAVAFLASKRGRNPIGWFFASLLTTPLLGFVFVLVLRDLATQPGQPTPETHVHCPDCRELVLKDARKCKHCGCKLIPQ